MNALNVENRCKVAALAHVVFCKQHVSECAPPWVAARANPKDAGATIYNAITAGISTQGVVQIGAGLLGAAGWAAAAAPFLFGLHRGLNKQVIDTPGKSVQEGTRKLIWDPIHKMVVKG